MEFKVKQKENFGGFSLSKPKPEEIKDKPASEYPGDIYEAIDKRIKEREEKK